MGWLHAIPEAPREKKNPDRRNRMQRIRDEGAQPRLPPVHTARRLIDWLFEVGPTVPGGAGPVPLTHSEIRCWQENTGLRLTPWELRTLRRLSGEYLGELHAAERADRPSPIVVVPTAEARADVGKKVRNAMQLLMKTRPQR